ncbi:flagellar motor protein MotB [Lysobacteraceae bacterium NML03-0222]|nr:flagellar motor protein MotB [Xanthomonadaceae bacterium NML03-0222]PJK04621.1 flagellar motor protein MotB [Xanthomonadaceae bacterium NML71-0210]
MENTMKKQKALLALATIAGLALSACSTHVSRDITPQGVAGEVVFPEIKGAYQKNGTFPRPADVRLVQPGLDKDQLYALIGTPHFAEGFYRVREWDYLFHFRTDSGVKTCQFKIIFDREYLARSLHWQPQDCAQVLEPEVAATAPVTATAKALAPFELDADGLFAFGGSGLSDLSSDGRQRLAALAAQLKNAGQLKSVDVLAYTDEIGTSASNLALSQSRAETVRSYLIAEGVAPSLVRAVGMGEAQPVKVCDSGMSRQARIACLAPNRRVEVRALGLQN